MPPVGTGPRAVIGAVAVVVLLMTVAFFLGRGVGRGSYVNEEDTFDGRVVAYQPRSICVVPDGRKSVTCGIPVVDTDTYSIKTGDHVAVTRLQVKEGRDAGEAFVVRPAG